jgi:hypothetical protein
MADTTVKYFHSGMANAPVLSGSAGALIAVLDACLVNGLNLQTLDSLVIAGGIATATRAAGITGPEVGSVQLITGATVTGGTINGEQKVLTVTATTYTFATTLANQTATGTITSKQAPAGWAKTYTGTNLAAYKPTDVTATGCLLRVDDTGTTVARVVGYEAMSDVNTGTGPFPTAAQRSGGSYWSKSSTANSTARNWMVIADGRFVYFARNFHASNTTDYELSVFGDMVPTKSGDAFACVISGQASDVSGAAVAIQNNYWQSEVSGSYLETYSPRSYTGIGSAIQLRKSSPAILNSTTSWQSGATTSSITYPNPEDGGLYVSPHYLIEHSPVSFRGVSPGFWMVPQSVANGQFAARDSVTGVTGLSGRTLKALTCGLSPLGVCFFDITGPWR